MEEEARARSRLRPLPGEVHRAVASRICDRIERLPGVSRRKCKRRAQFQCATLFYGLAMSLTLLILADPAAPWLKLMDRLNGEVRIIVSDTVDGAREGAAQADVIVN